jgi:ABC-type branched-subunit amino acid transport system permease subunit
MATSSLLVSVATIAAIWALFALGLNIKFGYTGLLDFGHVAFFLIGAYTTALLVAPPSETQQFQDYILGWAVPGRLVELTGLHLAGGVGWFVAIAIGTLAAGVFGLLVALPAIRLREDYLAIALLGISVIVKRTVQTDTWLANGPDALRGYPRPLQGLFPLPGYGAEQAVLYAGIVFALWTIAIALLSQEALIDDGFGPGATTGSTVLNGVFAVLTLGFGYVGARRARSMRRQDGKRAMAPVVGAGLVATLIGFLLVAFAFFFEALLLTLGTLSVFVWVYAGVATRHHFTQLTRRESTTDGPLTVWRSFNPVPYRRGAHGNEHGGIGRRAGERRAGPLRLRERRRRATRVRPGPPGANRRGGPFR